MQDMCEATALEQYTLILWFKWHLTHRSDTDSHRLLKRCPCRNRKRQKISKQYWKLGLNLQSTWNKFLLKTRPNIWLQKNNQWFLTPCSRKKQVNVALFNLFLLPLPSSELQDVLGYKTATFFVLFWSIKSNVFPFLQLGRHYGPGLSVRKLPCVF